MMTEFRFEPYDSDLCNTWDNFVRVSRNATFLFERGFMEYHAPRFDDRSLLVYRNEKPVALIPAHQKDGVFYSHQGLTYGGFALAPSLHGNETVELFEAFRSWLSDNGFSELIYKPVPHIYHRLPSEDELYALHRIGAVLHTRTLSSTLSPLRLQPYSSLRKRGIKKAQQANVACGESSRWGDYWDLLSSNLMQRHGVQPVHNISEIAVLNGRFPQNIRLFTAEKDQELWAGVVVFDVGICVHAQYIAASDEGKKAGALDLLFDYLIREVYSSRQWFDFGISTEQAGALLNTNLLLQKEGFGARGVVYDSYRLTL